MKINCPNCQCRPLSEFSYQGDASRQAPALEAETEVWVDYIYQRENPCGWHWEYWWHELGCRAWLKVERHTLSHEIRHIGLAQNTK